MAGNDEQYAAQYSDDEKVQGWVGKVEDIAKQLSADFEPFDDEEEQKHIKGPGLYVVFYKGHDMDEDGIAEPMTGEGNVWHDLSEDDDTTRYIQDPIEEQYDEWEEAAYDDGAIVVFMNGKLHPYMMNLYTPPEDVRDEVNYQNKDGGTRHTSAAQNSARDEILTAITLSEERGDVTVFEDGEAEEYVREEFADDHDILA
ncbi:MAG: diadenylate cyclase [Candidatus Nanohaloarchaea archaeon]|nr:diadenylate cyclase [Candidatus Nanohaloarchaea archaeon]